MPAKPQRPCKKPGCPVLTRDRSGYCEEHKQQEARRYEQQRGTPAQRGYGYRWMVYSRAFRRRNPLCVMCLTKGRYVPSEHVDHIVAVSGPDDPLFWDPSNHRALCRGCHSSKTAKEDGRWGK
jgi:5-methylcytosine-specific restriction protein A